MKPRETLELLKTDTLLPNDVRAKLQDILSKSISDSDALDPNDPNYVALLNVYSTYLTTILNLNTIASATWSNGTPQQVIGWLQVMFYNLVTMFSAGVQIIQEKQSEEDPSGGTLNPEDSAPFQMLYFQNDPFRFTSDLTTASPQQVAATAVTVVNNSNDTQTSSVDLSYAITNESTLSFQAGISLGIEQGGGLNIGILSASFKLSASFNFSVTASNTSITTTSVSQSQTVDVPANQQQLVEVLYSLVEAQGPYTAYLVPSFTSTTLQDPNFMQNGPVTFQVVDSSGNVSITQSPLIQMSEIFPSVPPPAASGETYPADLVFDPALTQTGLLNVEFGTDICVKISEPTGITACSTTSAPYRVVA